MESIRERLASLTRRELAGLAAVAFVALGGVGLWYLRSMPRPVEVRGSTAPAVSAVSGPVPAASGGVVPVPDATPSASPTEVVVDVTGWVRHPGVYRFDQGQRVIDALRSAGGPRKGAALQSLNLAAVLTDAEQILVPKPGQVAAIVPAGSTPASTSTGTTSTTGAKVNLNTATESDLEALPGIGPVLAQRIIDYRTQNGQFATVDDLDNVSGIGPATMADLRDLVTV